MFTAQLTLNVPRTILAILDGEARRLGLSVAQSLPVADGVDIYIHSSETTDSEELFRRAVNLFKAKMTALAAWASRPPRARPRIGFR